MIQWIRRILGIHNQPEDGGKRDLLRREYRLRREIDRLNRIREARRGA